jgi:DNA-binding transcriptional LysR family regulator
MNFNLLETFRQTIKLKSFSKAAIELHLSQPAVSLQIGKLERELGVHLLDRNTKSFTLTHAGLRLYRFAEKVHSDHSLLLKDIQKSKQGYVNKIKIICNNICEQNILPEIISKYIEHDYRAQITVESHNSYEVIDLVDRSSNIIGFCSLNVKHPKLPSITYTKVDEDEQVLIVHPAHPLSSLHSVSIEDLIGQPIIMRATRESKKPVYYQELLAALKIKGYEIDDFGPLLMFDSTMTLLKAVEANVGVAIISSLPLRKNISSLQVKQLTIKDFEYKRNFYYVYKQNNLTDPLINDFLSFLNNMYHNAQGKVAIENKL